MDNRVQCCGNLSGFGVLENVTSHSDPNGTGIDGVFHHLQESIVVTHGSSAENNDGHPTGVDDGFEFIYGSVGWKGSFDDVSPELRGCADGEADVLDRVVIGATNRKGKGFENNGDVRFNAF